MAREPGRWAVEAILPLAKQGSRAALISPKHAQPGNLITCKGRAWAGAVGLLEKAMSCKVR